ncbi:polysaccharide biosynthesis/export family protein [Sphingobium chungbukense]|uniref:Capsular biosynthesis protein n=1 Tax=Sphingobium chungbukense TaxID=56193 RepID=A0A0M3ATC4_9SPHN|nr:polysaccharide biosynthesis/export family protein [Sphingobium chungbukense]KKW93105.1 capsular biosynthesis protein [Sphingobium chungbukense]
MPVLLSGCSFVPAGGPRSDAINRSADRMVGESPIRVIDLDATVAKRVAASTVQASFSETLGDGTPVGSLIGRGDIVSVELWEAPPAVLFGGGIVNLGSGATASPRSQLTEQMVDPEGKISIPFVGLVQAAGRTPTQLGQVIERGLTGKAHAPQALVKVITSASRTVTVMGEVNNSSRVPLTPKGERLLDVLASVGGTRQPVGKMTVQVTRDSRTVSMPLERVVANPPENIRLQPDDLVTALYQPYSFTALGATGRNEEIPFEATGITLSQALGRVSGLQDMRANVSGVFIFRMESPAALGIEVGGEKIPVIYRIDLRDPVLFFAAQSFPVRNQDILYVSNAPLADFQKFVNVIASSVLPVVTVSTVVP